MQNCRRGGGWQVLAAVAALLVVLCAFVALVPASEGADVVKDDSAIPTEVTEVGTYEDLKKVIMGVTGENETVTTEPKAANVVLTSNITMAADEILYISNNIQIDLAGFSITKTGSTKEDLTIFDMGSTKSQTQTVDGKEVTVVVPKYDAATNKATTFTIIDSSAKKTGSIVLNLSADAVESGVIDAWKGDTLNLNGITIKSDKTYGVYSGDGATVNSNDSTIESYYSAISGNGLNKDTVLNIRGGTYTSTDNVAIFFPSTKTLNIEGAELIGVGGMDIRNATVVVKDTKITMKGEATGVNNSGPARINVGIGVYAFGSSSYGDADVTLDNVTILNKSGNSEAIDIYFGNLNSNLGGNGDKTPTTDLSKIFDVGSDAGAYHALALEVIDSEGKTVLQLSTKASLRDGETVKEKAPSSSIQMNYVGENLQMNDDAELGEVSITSPNGNLTREYMGATYSVVEAVFATGDKCYFGIHVDNVDYTGQPITVDMVNPQVTNFGVTEIEPKLFLNNCTIVESSPVNAGTYHVKCTVNVSFNVEVKVTASGGDSSSGDTEGDSGQSGNQDGTNTNTDTVKTNKLNRNVTVTVPFEIVNQKYDVKVEQEGWTQGEDPVEPAITVTDAEGNKVTDFEIVSIVYTSVSDTTKTYTDASKLTAGDYTVTVVIKTDDPNYGESTGTSATFTVAAPDKIPSKLKFESVTDEQIKQLFSGTTLKVKDIQTVKVELSSFLVNKDATLKDSSNNAIDFTCDAVVIGKVVKVATNSLGTSQEGYYLILAVSSDDKTQTIWQQVTSGSSNKVSYGKGISEILNKDASYVTKDSPVSYMQIALTGPTKDTNYYTVTNATVTVDFDGTDTDGGNVYGNTQYTIDVSKIDKTRLLLLDEDYNDKLEYWGVADYSEQAYPELVYFAEGDKFVMPNGKGTDKAFQNWEMITGKNDDPKYPAGSGLVIKAAYANEYGEIILDAVYGDALVTPVDPTPGTAATAVTAIIDVTGTGVEVGLFGTDGYVPAGEVTVVYVYVDSDGIASRSYKTFEVEGGKASILMTCDLSDVSVISSVYSVMVVYESDEGNVTDSTGYMGFAYQAPEAVSKS